MLESGEPLSVTVVTRLPGAIFAARGHHYQIPQSQRQLLMSQNGHESLTQNEAYDLLSNPRRRFVISHLRQHGDPMSVSDLSDAVAAWENDQPVEDLTDRQVKRVYVSLYQTHLPKLKEAGLLHYDQETGVVSSTSAVDELDNYMPQSDTADRRWPLVYAGIAVTALTVYLLVIVAIPGEAGAVTELFGLLTIGVFAVVAVAHYLSQ